MDTHSVTPHDTMSMTGHSMGPEQSLNAELVTSAVTAVVRGGTLMKTLPHKNVMNEFEVVSFVSRACKSDMEMTPVPKRCADF